MPVLKVIYPAAHQLLNGLVLLFSAYSLGYSSTGKLQWLCLLIITLAPTVQLIMPYDRQPSNNQKIRLPLVSALIVLAIGLLLLVAPPGVCLWLGLACLAGFLINNNLAD